jgi:hypothetical protein
MRYLLYAFIVLIGPAATGVNFAQAAQCPAQTSRQDPEKIISVKFEGQNAVVGEPFRLTWAVPARISSPQYLIIGTPDTVRFGKGNFFALRPDAPAPLNAGFGNSLAQVIIPLHSAGEPNGEIEIIPFRAGEMPVTWAVVAPLDCPSAPLTEPQRKTVSVKSGRVELVAKEDFSLRPPTEVRRSNNGAYEVLIFKDKFQVVDASSGELIFQREGKNPTFSPTSRFLLHETFGEQTVEITDLVSGVQIYRGMAAAAAFTLEDSFATIAHWGAGMTFLRTMQDTARWVEKKGDGEDPALAGNKKGDAGTKTPDQKAASPNLGDSLAGHRFIGSDGFFGGNRAFRLSLEAGTIAYQEQSADGPDDYDKTAVEVRDLATRQVMDPASELATNEAKKFARIAPDRELDSWVSGHKVSLIFRQPGGMEGSSLTNTSRTVGAVNGNTKRLIVENVAGKRRAMTVGGKLASGTQSSFFERMNAFVGIAKYETRAAIRTSANETLAREIEQELSGVYDPRIARFGSNKLISYESTPFPDPAPANPGAQAETVQIDLSKPGYVIWRWALGDTRYWFGQTVEAGRRARLFRYNLLAWDGKQARSIDLVQSAGRYQDTLARPPTALEPMEIGDFRIELDNAIHEPAIVTTIADRFVAFVLKPSSWLYVFDLKSWKPHCLIGQAVDAGITSWITLGRDLSSVFQFNSDGTFSVYSCASGLRILSGAYLDDELIAMHASGFFEGSSYEAETTVKLRIPGIPGKHFLRQYAAKLRHPGLVADVMAGKALQAPDLKPPPVLTMVEDKQNGSNRGMQLSTEPPVYLKELQLFGDGMPFRRIALSGRAALQKLPASELGAYRTITAVAVDSEDVTSAAVLVKSNISPSYKQGTLFAVGTGIDEYKDTQLPKLTYASSDARRISESLRFARGYAGVSSTIIPGRDATAQNVLAAVRKAVQTATPTDTILFFFSGHGLEGPGGTLALALPETDTANLSNTALRWDDVAAALSSSRARVVVLLDACHSGLSDRMQTTNDQAASRLVGHGGTPMVILSASKGRQFSEESGIAGGGHFSLAFARIIGKERAAFDLDKNGTIDLDELYQGVKESVSKSTNGRQTPWLSRNELTGSFPLF